MVVERDHFICYFVITDFGSVTDNLCGLVGMDQTICGDGSESVRRWLKPYPVHTSNMCTCLALLRQSAFFMILDSAHVVVYVCYSCWYICVVDMLLATIVRCRLLAAFSQVYNVQLCCCNCNLICYSCLLYMWPNFCICSSDVSVGVNVYGVIFWTKLCAVLQLDHHYWLP